MPLHPTVVQVLKDYPILPKSLTEELIVKIREIDRAVPLELRPPIFQLEDITIPGPNREIPVRVYTPVESEEALPAIVYLHGGGWSLGSVENYDAVCRQLANTTQCKVFSVDYCLAPEHKFPQGLEECYAATEWIFANAGDLKIDSKRISICGDSAGGNLSAAVTLLCRERNGPKLWRQVLIYPAVDALLSIDHSPYESIRTNAHAPILPSSLTLSFWQHYLNNDSDATNIYASPIQADLQNVPPALVITAEYDSIRDEGEAYAARLQDHNIPAKVIQYKGLVHGFLTLPLPINQQVHETIALFLHDS